MKNKPTYEDFSKIIDNEISKRKRKWNLNSIAWMDFDDVAQIIRIHIHNKWCQYDSSRPIEPWLNTIISNKIRNLIRDNYGNYTRPCLKCDAAQDNSGCRIYERQCDLCPLYADWVKRKLPAHNIKLPVSIENHLNEVQSISYEGSPNISVQVEKIHIKMKQTLKPLEYKVYEGLFILNEDESTVAKKLGYISNEKGRAPGYKQIKNIRKSIILKIKKYITNGEIDHF